MTGPVPTITHHSKASAPIELLLLLTSTTTMSNEWTFSYLGRSYFDDDSDDDDDEQEGDYNSGVVGSSVVRPVVNTREEEAVVYKESPWTIARINARSRMLAADRAGLSVTSSPATKKSTSPTTMKDLKSLIEKETSLPELVQKKDLNAEKNLKTSTSQPRNQFNPNFLARPAANKTSPGLLRSSHLPFSTAFNPNSSHVLTVASSVSVDGNNPHPPSSSPHTFRYAPTASSPRSSNEYLTSPFLAPKEDTFNTLPKSFVRSPMIETAVPGTMSPPIWSHGPGNMSHLSRTMTDEGSYKTFPTVPSRLKPSPSAENENSRLRRYSLIASVLSQSPQEQTLQAPRRSSDIDGRHQHRDGLWHSSSTPPASSQNNAFFHHETRYVGENHESSWLSDPAAMSSSPSFSSPFRPAVMGVPSEHPNMLPPFIPEESLPRAPRPNKRYARSPSPLPLSSPSPSHRLPPSKRLRLLDSYPSPPAAFPRQERRSIISNPDSLEEWSTLPSRRGLPNTTTNRGAEGSGKNGVTETGRFPLPIGTLSALAARASRNSSAGEKENDTVKSALSYRPPPKTAALLSDELEKRDDEGDDGPELPSVTAGWKITRIRPEMVLNVGKEPSLHGTRKRSLVPR
ncbi:hypothetical protein DL93DRAFT_2154781 [Clavulina sp. PMI_390]|nr:hypothetical protein DL93DRAFT_2154781 [Clavulina sp. PMI_390]